MEDRESDLTLSILACSTDNPVFLEHVGHTLWPLNRKVERALEN